MKRRSLILSTAVLAIATFAPSASAQSVETPATPAGPEESLATPATTFEDVVEIEVLSGKVVHCAGQTVVVDVTEGRHPGIHEFVMGSRSTITRNGVSALAFDLRPGDRIVQTMITTRRVPVRYQQASEAPAETT